MSPFGYSSEFSSTIIKGVAHLMSVFSTTFTLEIKGKWDLLFEGSPGTMLAIYSICCTLP